MRLFVFTRGAGSFWFCVLESVELAERFGYWVAMMLAGNCLGCPLCVYGITLRSVFFGW